MIWSSLLYSHAYTAFHDSHFNAAHYRNSKPNRWEHMCVSEATIDNRQPNPHCFVIAFGIVVVILFASSVSMFAFLIGCVAFVDFLRPPCSFSSHTSFHLVACLFRLSFSIYLLACIQSKCFHEYSYVSAHATVAIRIVFVYGVSFTAFTVLAVLFPIQHSQ